MKTWKNLSLIGLVAMVAIFALAFIGCDTPSSPSPAPLAAVTPPPPALSGTVSNTQEGYELTATYDGDEEVSYQWYKDGVAIEGATDATYTPIADGSYTVIVSAEGYASQTSDPIEVTLETLEGEVSVSPNTDVLANTELTATYSGDEVVSYQWKKNGTNIGSNSNKFTPTEYGSYTVTVSLVGYNSKTSDPVTIFGVLTGEVSLAQFGEVSVYTELTATYTGSEGVSYQWKKDGVTVGTNSNKFTPTEAGTYTVTVSLANYTEKVSGTVNVTLTFTDITALAAYLAAQSANTAANPYIVKLNVADFPSGGYGESSSTLQKALQLPNKYVSLDLSDSTFTTIGQYAFYNCTSLISVTIPDSVINMIGQTVFYSCTSLVNIYVSENNTVYNSVDGVLFNKAKTTLIHYPAKKTQTSFTIPDSVTTIGYYAFYNCTSLVSVTIPNSVTSIKQDAFSQCTSLASVTIPDSVTDLGRYAFEGCSSLTSITIGNSVTEIDWGTFRQCTSLASVIIPDSVTFIGTYAFEDCTSLTSVTIGNSVTSIGEMAFYNCTSLASVTIGNSVTEIGQYAFYGCTSLESITIPNSVTYIGENVFRSCANLTSIAIPDSVDSIGYRAFYFCRNLASVTIGNSVTSIGEEAFDGCTSLTSITIPSSVTSIGKQAFYQCYNLISATFEGVIAADNFSTDTFRSGDLRTKYLAGGIGTYTCSGDVWTKQP